MAENNRQCLLVKGWGKGASWTFPRGKINQDEPERDCAIREVREETGFDISSLLPADSRDYFELTQREQKIRLYVVPGVPLDTKFETKTRREISRIEWFKLSELPTPKKPKVPAPAYGGKFYMVMPFMMRVRRWIQANKRTHPRAPPSKDAPTQAPTSVNLDALFAPAPGVAERPASTKKPGLIALPPAAMQKMTMQQQARAAAQTERSVPEEVSKKDLLLSLLQPTHKSGPPAPLPPPPQLPELTNRVDGSTALRALLGLGQSTIPVLTPPPPPPVAPQAMGSPAVQRPPPPPSADQRSTLLSILGGGKPALVPSEPLHALSTPAAVPSPMPTPQNAHGVPSRPPQESQHALQSRPSPMVSSPAPPSPMTMPTSLHRHPPSDEHRQRLLASLLGGAPQSPRTTAGSPHQLPAQPPSNILPQGHHMPSPGLPPASSMAPGSHQYPVMHMPVGMGQHGQPMAQHAAPSTPNWPTTPAPPQAPPQAGPNNLLSILNGPPSAKQNQPTSPAATPAPNPLLATLLGGPR